MFDAKFPYKLSHFEPLHLSVSTLVVFWALEQKKQLHIRIGQTQSDRDLLLWFEKRFSEKKYCPLFETSLYIISPSWTASCRLNPLLSSCYGMKFQNKVLKKSGIPPIILFLLQWLSPDFLQIKTLNFGFSLFKHDDNLNCQLLHGWIHLGRSFLRVKP